MKWAVRSSYLLTLVWTFLFVAVFFPSLNEPFLVTYGDGQAVVENPSIRILDLPSIQKMFTERDGEVYKPLTTLFYAVEFHFFKFYAPAFHATHLLIHWLNTLLIFILLSRLGMSKMVASLATLALDIHPMRAESAIWIAQLDNILSSFFCLLALLGHLKSREARSWWGAVWRFGSWLAYVAACLSDAAFSVGLPLVLWVIDRYQGQKDRRPLSLLPFAAVSIVIAVFALAGSSAWPPLRVTDFFSLSFFALIYHAGMFFAPLILSPYHPRPEVSALVLILAFFAVGVCGWMISRRHKHPGLFLGFVFYISFFAPKIMFLLVSGSDNFFSDHDSYLPVVGLVFAAAGVAERLLERQMIRKRAGLILFAAWVLWLSWVAASRTATFKSDINVWTDALKTYPQAQPALFGRGKAYLLAKQYAAAAEDLKKVTAMDPKDTLAHFHLSQALIKGGKIEEGQDVLRRMQAMEPDNSESWSLLGDSYLDKGDNVSAKEYFEKALSINPNDWRALSGLGALVTETGDLKGALVYIDKATALEPSSPVPYARSYALYTLLFERRKAGLSFRMASKWEPDTNDLLLLFKREFKRAGSSYDYEDTLMSTTTTPRPAEVR